QVIVIQHKWWRKRRIQDLDLACQHLDLPGRNVRIDRSLRARTYLAHHLQHELITHSLRDLKSFGCIRIHDDLRHALSITQIDKNNTAVITSSVSPTTERYSLAYQFSV